MAKACGVGFRVYRDRSPLNGVANPMDHETLDFAGVVKQDPFASGDQFPL